VTDMSFMFGITPEFNNGGSPSISNGIHLKLLICQVCFISQAFNQDIGTKVVTVNGITYTAWDTLNVTDMNCNVSINTAFNGGSPSISNWNTLKVTNMKYVSGSNLIKILGQKWLLLMVLLIQHGIH
jgi:hypothetical protein